MDKCPGGVGTSQKREMWLKDDWKARLDVWCVVIRLVSVFWHSRFCQEVMISVFIIKLKPPSHHKSYGNVSYHREYGAEGNWQESWAVCHHHLLHHSQTTLHLAVVVLCSTFHRRSLPREECWTCRQWMERTGLPQYPRAHGDSIWWSAWEEHSFQCSHWGHEGRWMELSRKWQILFYHMTCSVPVAHPWATMLWIKVPHWDLGSFP